MLFLLSFLCTATAEISLQVEKMEINGLPIRSLECTLKRDSMMAALQIGTALSTAKKDLDLCIPEGGVVKIQWNWSQQTPEVQLLSISKEEAKTCVKKSAEQIQSTIYGRCSAIVLLGERSNAEKAAESLE